MSFHCKHAFRCESWTLFTSSRVNSYTVCKFSALEGGSVRRAFLPTPLKAMKGGRSRMKKDGNAEKRVKGNNEMGRIGENERIKENMELASVLMLVKTLQHYSRKSSVGPLSHAGSTGYGSALSPQHPEMQVTVIFFRPTISTLNLSRLFMTCHCRILSTATPITQILMSTHKITFNSRLFHYVL